MRRFFECVLIVWRFYFSPSHWKVSWSKFLLKFVWLVGFFWLGVELTHFFFDTSSPFPREPVVFWFALGVSLIASFFSTIPLLTVKSQIDNRDIAIKLVLGSVFNQGGDIALATNTTFDTTLQGDFISKKSIQGQLAKREYRELAHLDHEIKQELSQYTPKETLSRTTSKNARYDVGTVIKLTHGSKFKSYWVALADVNESGKPHGTFEDLQHSLETLWEYVADKGHMTRLVIPILGSGKTGIKEPRMTILKEIVFSFVAYAAERKITEELVLCIHPKDVSHGRLNMQELAKYLDYQCRYRYTTRQVSSGSTETG